MTDPPRCPFCATTAQLTAFSRQYGRNTYLCG
jgi:hypothetical protein